MSSPVEQDARSRSIGRGASIVRAFCAPLLAASMTLTPAPAAAQQAGPLLAPEQVVSAARACIAAHDADDFEFKERLFRRLGWRKVATDGGLDGIMTPYWREDGAVVITLATTCIVKTRMSPEGLQALPAAISADWSLQPQEAQGGSSTWRTPEWKIELTPGPVDGSNVSVSLTRLIEGIDQ